VVEASGGRLVWVDPASGEELATVDENHPGWDGFHTPNGLHAFEADGHSYALMSSRTSADSPLAADGRLVLWDITSLDAVEAVWTYPETGTLGMPHAPVMRPWREGWLLAYAHTEGDHDSGTAGFAWTAEVTVLPDYLGDGRLPDTLGSLDAMRGLEVDADGRVFMAESVELFRRGGGNEGRVTRATLPELTAPGLTGARADDGATQSFFTFDDAATLNDDLEMVYQARLYTPGW